jgi:hypothetical protein
VNKEPLRKELFKMAIEDKFDGAKNGLSFYYAYLKEVARETGMDNAVSIGTKVDSALGAATGRKLKEQLGNKECDLLTAVSMALDTIKEGFGITSMVVSESPQKIVTRCGKCPVYEACMDVGMDSETTENLCHTGSLEFMDAMIKELNPKLSYKLTKFRSSADDFCEETIMLS